MASEYVVDGKIVKLTDETLQASSIMHLPSTSGPTPKCQT